jgi:hypothetical protein
MSKDLTIRNSTAEFLIFQSQSREDSIEVKFAEDMIWLSQKMMAKLFDVDVRTINEHLKNIFDQQELIETSTIRNFRIVQKEGNRQVNRNIDFYSLDAIISIGYRVNSKKATTEPQVEPAKKSTKKPRVIPALITYSPDPFLALNDAKVPSAAILGMEEAEPLKLEKSRVKIRVHLPEVKGYYGPDTTQTESAELGGRLWAYASNQFDRIVAGEKPSLPKTKSKISIPLPDFINRQFANSK